MAAQATVLTFDGLPPVGASAVPVPNGTYGFTYNNVWYLDGAAFGGGFANAVVSSPNVIFNGFGGGASMTSATTFDLNDGYFTGGFNDGFSVTIAGWLGGVGGTLVGSKTFTVSVSNPTLETFNFAGIDTIEIDGSGNHVAIDDLRINDPFLANAPEPGTIGLMFAALVPLAWKGKRLIRRK